MEHGPDAFRRHRLAAGIDQQTMAQRARVSTSVLSRFELGQRPIDLDMLFRLTMAYELVLEEIIQEALKDAHPLGYRK